MACGCVLLCAAPPSPPYHGPRSYSVAGAGNAKFNGVYNHSAAAGGRFVRVSPTVGGSGGEAHAAARPARPMMLYEYGGEWRLAVLGEQLGYVSTHVGGSTPPLDGWVVPAHKPGTAPVVGVAPPPHLSLTHTS